MQDENKQDQATEQDQAEPQVEPTPDAEQSENTENDLDTRLKELEENFKKQLRGLNQRNSELEKKLKDKELEGLSEKERIEAELNDKKKMVEELESESKRMQIKNWIDSSLYENDLSVQKWGKRIVGSSQDEIVNDIEALSADINEEAERRAQKIINEKFSGSVPKIGKSPDDNSLKAQYDKAVKGGDSALAISIKRAAGRQGITL